MLDSSVMCSKGVGVNSILCQTCNLWIHKRCSGVKGKLKKENMFRSKKCKGESTPTDSLNSTQVHVGEDRFESVPTFQYLGDMIGQSGGYEDDDELFLWYGWPTKGVALFPVGTIVRDPHHRESPTYRELAFDERSSGFDEWSCAVVIITARQLHQCTATGTHITAA